MPRMIILDGNSLAHRAFYALPMLTTADGRPTNVLHGFMTMLLKLQQEQQPDYWVVAFDKTKATVRIEQYAEYKAQRKETPEGLRPQFDYLKEVLAGFAVPIIELAGYEADDLIAAVTKQAERQDWEVQIYTGDRDAFQLISAKTNVFLTKKGISEVEHYDVQALWEKYQLRPEQIIDLKGLMGDSSDNIPGVPGVGEKTALKLLWEFGSVEEVLARAGEVKGQKLQDKLEEYADQALLSKKLATMLTEVPMEFHLEGYRYRTPESEAALAVLNKYNLRNVTRLWQEKYGGQTKVGAVKSQPLPESVQTAEKDQTETEVAGGIGIKLGEPEYWEIQCLSTAEWVSRSVEWRRDKARLVIAYRLEATTEAISEMTSGVITEATTGMTGMTAFTRQSVVEWAVAVEGKVFVFRKPEVSAENEQAWIDLLADPQVPKVVGDGKGLYTAMSGEGAAVQGVCLDLSLAAYLLNPTRNSFDALSLAQEYFLNLLPFGGIGQEASALAQAAPLFEADLRRLDLMPVLQEIEAPLSPILVQMEQRGIAIDVPSLKAFGQDLSVALVRLEQEIHALADERFNLNSPQQLGKILFDKLGLPPVKKTKTGYSTDAETLEELRSAHPIVEKILEYRQLNKLMTTYVNGLSAQVREGRIHTTFQQTVTATGRLSSTEPNLQNIPIRLEYGRLLRKVFLPTQPGWHLLSADYSQIELRILAHYAQDRLLIESFSLGQDVHSRTAAEVFGIPLAEVTSDLRRKAKAVNFGLVYGLTDYGLSRDLGIPRREAKYYIEQYFTRYYGVKNYLEGVVAKAKQTGEVRTLSGRLRRIPELYHPNRVQRQFGERIAMNTPIQGTAADIMKLAMIAVARELERKNYQAKMLLQVHDEILLEVPSEELEQVAALVQEQMQNAFTLSVPLTVECKYGSNWYDMQTLVQR